MKVPIEDSPRNSPFLTFSITWVMTSLTTSSQSGVWAPRDFLTLKRPTGRYLTTTSLRSISGGRCSTCSLYKVTNPLTRVELEQKPPLKRGGAGGDRLGVQDVPPRPFPPQKHTPAPPS